MQVCIESFAYTFVADFKTFLEKDKFLILNYTNQGLGSSVIHFKVYKQGMINIQLLLSPLSIVN